MSALPELTVSNFERRAEDPREGRLLRTLSEAYPFPVSAKQLMIRIGLDYHADPFRSFVVFLNLRIRVNQFLSRHGLQAVRSGGSPDDIYRLSSSDGG